MQVEYSRQEPNNSSTLEDEAVRRVWVAVTRRLALKRRRALAVLGSILALGALGASAGAVAYATGLSEPASTGSPILKSEGKFGDENYVSSPAEEASLRSVAKLAKRMSAVGYYRADGTHIVVRLAPGDSLIGSSQHLDNFDIAFVASQFSPHSRDVSRQEATDIARDSGPGQGGFIIDYDPKSDQVVVSGDLSQSAIAELNRIQGVHAVENAGMSLQGEYHSPAEWSTK